MSERRTGFVQDCLDDVKTAARGGLEGARIGYQVGEPAGLGLVGAAVGFVAGARVADKLNTYRQVRERLEQGGNS